MLNGVFMEISQLVHQVTYDLEGEEYLIEVFLRSDGSHFARTAFSPKDVIICDGPTLEDALGRHQGLLPLAVYSRQLVRPGRLVH